MVGGDRTTGKAIGLDAVARARAAARGYPPRRYGWWMVALLFCAAALSNLDRLLLSVLIDPVKADIRIDDVQMSMLTGPAYGMFYGIFGLLLGVMVDRGSRRLILAGGVVLWSLATLASGFATSFHQLFIARALVGLGEAAVVPAAASVLADFFPPHLRGRPIALYLVGASFGSGLSVWLPGLIATHELSFAVSGYGMLPAWRMSFILCGTVGPVIGALLLTTREPARQGGRVGGDVVSGVGGALRFLGRNAAVFAPIYAGFALFYLCNIGVAAWGPSFLMRTFDLKPSDIGHNLGLGLTISGVAGYLTAGLVVDAPRLRHAAGRVLVLMAACLVALPVAFCSLAPTPDIATLLLCSVTFAAPMFYVAANTTLQDLVPNDMRGLAVSINGLVANLIAFSGGPILISLVTERVLEDPARVGLSIGIVTGPALLLAAVTFGYCLGQLRRRRGTLEQPSAAPTHAAPDPEPFR